MVEWIGVDYGGMDWRKIFGSHVVLEQRREGDSIPQPDRNKNFSPKKTHPSILNSAQTKQKKSSKSRLAHLIQGEELCFAIESMWWVSSNPQA